MSVEFVSADQVAHAAACEAPLRLVDTFGRVARDLRVSLTDRCNLRCSYCMPPEGLDWLPTEETLTDAEVVRLVRIGVKRLGIRQVRFTGGEPLLRRGLEGIIAECSQLRTDEGQAPDLALTTNALGLAKRAQGLRDAGLDRVNISLDSLDREHYAAITRRDRLGDVLEGIEAAARAGLSPIKVNTLVLRGMNEADLPDLVDYCLDRGHRAACNRADADWSGGRLESPEHSDGGRDPAHHGDSPHVGSRAARGSALAGCALGLTYYTHGDTRGRGQAILAFKEVLRRAGFEMDREELPDHLPVVLEFAAFDETGTAEGLLRSNREGIEVIRTALRAADSPYAPLLDALVATLPEPDEKTIEGFRKLISQGPPTELVGVGDLSATPSPTSDSTMGR